MLLILAALLVLGAAMAAGGTSESTGGLVIVVIVLGLIVFVSSLGRREHHITYLLSNGKKCKLMFKIKGPPRETRDQFQRLLNEYMQAARSFQQAA